MTFKHKLTVFKTPLGCVECGKKANNSREFMNHMEGAHQKEAEYVKCEQCDFMSLDSREVESHRISKKHSRNMKLECPICNDELPSPAWKVEHVENIHGDLNASAESQPGDDGIKVTCNEDLEGDDEFALPEQFTTKTTLSDTEETILVTFKSVQKSMLFGKASGNLMKMIKSQLK